MCICVCVSASHLFGLLDRSLQVCLHLVSGVTRNLGNGLFKDGGRLSDGQSCVQVWFPSLHKTDTNLNVGVWFLLLPDFPPTFLSFLPFILLLL